MELSAAAHTVYIPMHTGSTQTVIFCRITNKLYCCHNKRCCNCL